MRLLAAITILNILTTGSGAVLSGQKPPVQYPAAQKTLQVKGVATHRAPSTCRDHSQTRHSLHKRADYEDDLGIHAHSGWRQFQGSRGVLLVAQDGPVFPVYSFAGPGLHSIGTYGLDGGIVVIAANAAYGMIAHVSLAKYWDGPSAAALRKMFQEARIMLKDATVYLYGR